MGRIFINKQTLEFRGKGDLDLIEGQISWDIAELRVHYWLFSDILLKEYFKSFCHDMYYVISHFMYCTWVWLALLVFFRSG